MSLIQALQSIDAEIADSSAEISSIRERIKKLHTERNVIDLKLTMIERQRKHKENVERGQKWKKENPKEHAAFTVNIKQRNRDDVIEGWLDGWWDLDDDFNPIQNAQIFHLTDFKDINNPLMAHVMARAGIFPSVGQARKNGWDSPLVIGEWIVTKQKKKIIVKE